LSPEGGGAAPPRRARTAGRRADAGTQSPKFVHSCRGKGAEAAYGVGDASGEGRRNDAVGVIQCVRTMGRVARELMLEMAARNEPPTAVER